MLNELTKYNHQHFPAPAYKRKIARSKFESYKPETLNMPFHFRLLSRDRMHLFSFIHSLNTTFDTSIFEPVAETIASLKFPVVRRQFVVGNKISEKAQKF